MSFLLICTFGKLSNYFLILKTRLLLSKKKKKNVKRKSIKYWHVNFSLNRNKWKVEEMACMEEKKCFLQAMSEINSESDFKQVLKLSYQYSNHCRKPVIHTVLIYYRPISSSLKTPSICQPYSSSCVITSKTDECM